MRRAGTVVEADRFDSLASSPCIASSASSNRPRRFDTQIANQTELVDKLKDGLNKLRVKREDLVQKRDELVSRAKMAQAQTKVQQTLRTVSVMDPTSELNRFEERIRRQEAMARGMEEVTSSSLDEEFAKLGDAEDDLQVEARLAALKSQAPQPVSN